MCLKSVTLLGLISLVALTGAKLRWKCELFDTSQETSTRTTFVEFVNGKPPAPVIPPDGPGNGTRTPRSPKCRPRPKNGTVGESTKTEKLVVERKKEMIQSDVSGSSITGGDENPNIKYQRKETHQSLDLNIGPGFEESNDPYGKSKLPAPKRFRPTKLKGADELDKPLTEHLDENVMPDFEFDEEDAPPIAEDLPWCPEETDEDCETADLGKMSMTELVELKQKCETTVSAERQELIEKTIRLESNRLGVIPDRTVMFPPTGTTNCSTNPSDLSDATIEKYRKECPCEDDTTKMSEEEFEIFKKECLEPIKIPGRPGHPFIRKSGRCGASEKRIERMSEKEYDLFVKECLVMPNVTLEKILIVKDDSECRSVDVKRMKREDVSSFKKKCVTSKTCDDVNKLRLGEKEMIQFKKMCSPSVTRKIVNICEEEDVEGMDDEQFERYMRECFLSEKEINCDSVDLDSLNDKEYEEYKAKCQDAPIDCDNVDPKELRGKKLKMYEKECLDSTSPPHIAPPIDCGKTDPATLNRRDYEQYDRLCLKPMSCKTVNPDELSDEEFKRYKRKCLKMPASECAKLIPKDLNDEEYKKYEEECLDAEVNCKTADSRYMTDEQYMKFEKVCLKPTRNCKNVNVKKLNEEEYEKFQKKCLKSPPKYNCLNVHVDELTDEEYTEYKEQCLTKERDFDCDTVDPKKLKSKYLKIFKSECVKKTEDCSDLKVEDLTDQEYADYEKKCLKKPRFDCSNVRQEELSGEELKEYKRKCLTKDLFDCESIDPKKLSKKEYKKFEKQCIKSNPDCKDINPEKLSDQEYRKYEADCLKTIPKNTCTNGDQKHPEECFIEDEFDCKTMKPDEMGKREYELFVKRCVKNSDDCKDVKVYELSDEEYEKYALDCLKTGSRSNCLGVNAKELSEKEYSQYKKDCLDEENNLNCDSIQSKKLTRTQFEKFEKECLERKSKPDCHSTEPKEMTDEEYEKYKKDCLKKPGKTNCDNIRPEDLNDKEYAKYKRDCLDSPRSSSNCDNVNVDDLSKKEYKKYEKECLSRPDSPSDCKNVDINELTEEEFSRYKKKCSRRPSPGGNPPPGTVDNEECKDVDVEKMTSYEYNVYKKYCTKEFEGENCDDIRADKLSDEKLRKYVDKCGLFCGIDRKEVLSEQQRREFEKRCEGDSNELEKDCKDVVIEKLGEIQYGAFAEKCLEPINACSMLKSRRLVRKVYNEYRLKCKPRVHYPDGSKCKEADTENMTMEEYRDYQRRCGKNGKGDCDSVKVEELNEQEYSEYKKQCEIDKTDENCKDVNVDELTRSEYQKYLKKCGRAPGPETVTDEECEEDVTGLNYKEFLSRAGPCRFNPDKIDKYCESIDWKTVKRGSLKREMTYQGLNELCPNSPSKDRSVPPTGESKNCSNANVEKMTEEEYLKYKKECGSPPRGGPDYPDRPSRTGCLDVKVEELTSDEYTAYKKRCLTPGGRTPPDESIDDCSNVDISKLSSQEYEDYKRKCKSIRKTPDCSMKDVSQLTDEEYRIYQKKCGSEGENVPGRPKKGCESVNVRELSNDEYDDYIKRCGEGADGERVSGENVKISKTIIINKPPTDESVIERPPDCDGVHVDKLTKEEYLAYKKKCEQPERPGKPTVTIEKVVKIVTPGKPGSPERSVSIDDCSNVNVAKLTNEEYEEYRKKCKSTRKTVKPGCEDVNVKSLSEDELEAYYKKCPIEIEEVPPAPLTEMECSDYNVEELDKEEFKAYKERCGHPTPPEGSPDCDNIRVEELTSEDYSAYKKRCLKTPRRPSVPDDNCSRVNTAELSEKEYRMYLRRCPATPEHVMVNKTIVINKGCQNGNTDGMTKEEYQQYQRECSGNPHVVLEKTVRIIGGGPPGPEMNHGEDDCLDVDVNRMSEEELEKYRARCGYHQTFQTNCNSDVTKMSDEEFKKFRKECGKKPFNCDTADVDRLSDKDYSRYLKECGKRSKLDCDNAKVERMSAEEYKEFKEKCDTPTVRKTINECDNVKVEELSRKEYVEYKEKCGPFERPTTPPTKMRRRIDCSIVDESAMSEQEYADFKKHCNVRVRTDRYRPGENIILTKQVNILTGKEKFSCYDQDVDHMSDEEYQKFEKKCLSNPHFRFDCRIVDTSELSREEYAKYQRECQQPQQPTIVLEKKLIINKTNTVVKDGCYNRDVNVMTDEEYGQYEVKCLGREPTPVQPKLERKISFDCHNVDLSKLSHEEIEEHLKRCRTRETASTPPPPRRQSLKCSDVETDSLDDEAYAKWVRECQETTPKNIELQKIIVINNTTPLLSGGETVIVEKYEIHEHLRPGDDDGYLEGNENFGVRVITGIRKRVIKGRPDGGSESENGVILVKKVIHKIPGRRRPTDLTDNNDEAGVIEVKRMIMKTSQPEPETDDSADIEEIMRRPPRKVGPKEEVVLLSVTKRNPHSYRKKNIPEEEEPTETVKLTKNTRHPNATLREVRIRKHFGTDVAEEAIVQEIGGPDFKITRKTVMIPHKVRKMKSTTTTTTTPSEPEYYYDEEEVPEVITLVKVEKSSRPLRKSSPPEDEDDEYVDVKENHPESYIEFEGYVKVHNTPRKIRKRTVFTDSGEEPDIREVTRKVNQEEEDDFKGVKLRSHRKKLILVRKIVPEEVPDDEHEVTVVKKLKVLKFGNEEKEHFDEDENVHEDGRIMVKNRKFMLSEKDKRPGDDEEDGEFVEGRVAVKGRAAKGFRLDQHQRKASVAVTERNKDFYKIGGSEEDDWERRRKRKEEELRPRALEEEEDGEQRRRRKPKFEEESEEYGRKTPRYEESEEAGGRRKGSLQGEDVIIKKLYRIGQSQRPERPDRESESVILNKKKVLKFGKDNTPEDDDENEEIKLRKRKSSYRFSPEGLRSNGEEEGPDGEMVSVTQKKVHRFGSDGKRQLVDQDEPTDGEMVKVSKKKVYRIGPDGKRELVDEESPDGKTERKSSRPIARDSPDDSGSEEFMMKKKKRFYRIRSDGKRELIREEEVRGGKGPQDDQGADEDQEHMMLKKKKRFYRTGPDGKRELIREEEGGSGSGLLGKKTSSYGPGEDQNEMDHEEIVMKKKKKRIYRIGKDGKRELVREEEVSGDGEGSEEQKKPSAAKNMRKLSALLGQNKNTYSPEPLNDSPADQSSGMMSQSSHDNPDDMTTHKRKRFYEIGSDGKKKLVKTEGDIGSSEVIGAKKTKRFYSVGKDGKRTLLRTEKSDDKPVSDDKSPVGGHLSVPDESPEDDGYEYETTKPRVKRTYVLDGKGNRKLVGEQSGDDAQDIDLGKLLRPRRKVTETETVDREHRESQFVKKKSSRSSRSSNGGHQGGGSMNHNKKMQKYHKDSSLRSGGKSEEDIPEEQ